MPVQKQQIINTTLFNIILVKNMTTVSLKTIHKDLTTLQKDVQFIKHMLAEDFELSESTKKDLEAARKTTTEEHINQEEMEKEFLK